MTYVIEDYKIKIIIYGVRNNSITVEEAKEYIKRLGFLDWEVDEAMKEIRKRRK